MNDECKIEKPITMDASAYRSELLKVCALYHQFVLACDNRSDSDFEKFVSDFEMLSDICSRKAASLVLLFNL